MKNLNSFYLIPCLLFFLLLNSSLSFGQPPKWIKKTKDKIVKTTKAVKVVKDLLDNEESPSTDSEETGQRSISQPTQTSPSRTPTRKLPSTPTDSKLPTTSSINYSGDWTLQVSVSDVLDRAGKRTEKPLSYEIGINLEIEGKNISGEFTWIKGDYRPCGIATIKGELAPDNTFEFVITYTGSCCRKSEMRVRGTFTSDKALTATIKPKGIPKDSACRTWWADATGEKD